MDLAVWLGIGMGLLAWTITAFAMGALVGLATFYALRVPRARVLLGAAAAAAMIGAGAFVTIHQAVIPAQSNGGWPAGFGTATGFAWAAVLFLAADAAVEIADRTARPEEGSGDRQTGDGTGGGGPPGSPAAPSGDQPAEDQSVAERTPQAT